MDIKGVSKQELEQLDRASKVLGDFSNMQSALGNIETAGVLSMGIHAMTFLVNRVHSLAQQLEKSLEASLEPAVIMPPPEPEPPVQSSPEQQ